MPTEEFIIPDPQQQPSSPCPDCGREVYAPTYGCCFCRRLSHDPG